MENSLWLMEKFILFSFSKNVCKGVGYPNKLVMVEAERKMTSFHCFLATNRTHENFKKKAM